ncbi:MAG: PfkB family carbohydrate kinase, partial [Phycisphaerales bacterium]
MNAGRKVISIPEAATRARESQRRGKTVVLCHGCFDIVHPGHLRHLLWARRQGDLLIVSVSADAVIDKGLGRPLVPERLRAENLAALECVDMVVVSHAPTAVETLDAVKPDRYVKGAEYRDSHDARLAAERDVVRAYGGKVLFSSGDVVYSSTRLITSHAREWALNADRVAGYVQRHHQSEPALRKLLQHAAGLRCLVVGDTIVDEYLHCDPTHIAGESPMMNATLVGKERFMGGAAIIAQHLRGLGANVTLATPIGRGRTSGQLMRLCHDHGVDVIPLRHGGRIPRKRRYLAKSQKLLKLDDPPPPAYARHATDEFVRAIDAAAPAWDVVALIDFGYGALGQDTLGRLVQTLRPRTRVMLGDVSGPRASLLSLKGCDVLMPTEAELRAALQSPEEGVATLAGSIANRAKAGHVIVKLGEDGAVAFDATRRDDTGRLLNDFLPSFARRAVDPLGCGDAMLSVVGLTLAAGGGLFDALLLGSVGAAIEAETHGNRALVLEPLLDRLRDELTT